MVCAIAVLPTVHGDVLNITISPVDRTLVANLPRVNTFTMLTVNFPEEMMRPDNTSINGDCTSYAAQNTIAYLQLNISNASDPNGLPHAYMLRSIDCTARIFTENGRVRTTIYFNFYTQTLAVSALVRLAGGSLRRKNNGQGLTSSQILGFYPISTAFANFRYSTHDNSDTPMVPFVEPSTNFTWNADGSATIKVSGEKKK